MFNYTIAMCLYGTVVKIRWTSRNNNNDVEVSNFTDNVNYNAFVSRQPYASMVVCTEYIPVTKWVHISKLDGTWITDYVLQHLLAQQWALHVYSWKVKAFMFFLGPFFGNVDCEEHREKHSSARLKCFGTTTTLSKRNLLDPVMHSPRSENA